MFKRLATCIVVALALCACGTFWDQLASSFGHTVQVGGACTSNLSLAVNIPDLGAGNPARTIHVGDSNVTIHWSPSSGSGFIVPTAESDCGVKSIVAYQSESVQYSTGDIGTTRNIDFLPDTLYQSNAQPGGQAQSRYWVPFMADSSVHTGVPASATSGSDVWTVTFTATDFSGGSVTSPTIIFVYDKP